MHRCLGKGNPVSEYNKVMSEYSIILQYNFQNNTDPVAKFVKNPKP